MNVLFSANSHVKVTIRTPVRITTSAGISDTIIQGDIFGSMFCSKQVDTFANECVEKNKYLYKHKYKVPMTPQTMVDDFLCMWIQNCNG